MNLLREPPNIKVHNYKWNASRGNLRGSEFLFEESGVRKHARSGFGFSEQGVVCLEKRDDDDAKGVYFGLQQQPRVGSENF